ncbi:MAG TPA: YbaB/EbfC family nucleoid-associated protein [Bacillota bacterium]|nr:YbaB/EbfC family nucleoid-associated protein [Bacillota bacterium]HOK68727.1 YbaB/EbfC family nucleoid-associated protein [Bacillota bacterium]HPP85735.1 YbaB/EbfC family nucleoid-associated protein [Bacillota bacterium]
MKVRLPKGIGGGPQDLNSMLKQAQKMQETMEALTAELEQREYEISAGGGVVTVKINGKNEIQHIEIKPEIIDPDDIETLQDILVAAVNEAIKKVAEARETEMAKVTGSFNLPGLPGMF